MSARYFTEYLQEFRSKPKLDFDAGVIIRHGDGEQVNPAGQVTDHWTGMGRSLPALESEATLGLVFPLQKRPGNAFDYISVGRTDNVDVILPLVQVSKFHAYFSRDPAGQYTLADGGSKNGTRVGSRQLEVRSPVPVINGDRISFGPYVFSFYTHQGLLELLRSKLRAAG